MTAQPVALGEGHFRVGRQDGPAEPRMQIGHCSFGSPDKELLIPLLPRMVLTRGERRLVTLMQLVDEETRARQPARDLILQRLLEVLLIEALRALHASPAHPWTVAELAPESTLSRSAFFARCSRTVGLPPIEYLLVWRIALARQLLDARELDMAQVAERVGYSSASTSSVAFARHAG